MTDYTREPDYEGAYASNMYYDREAAEAAVERVHALGYGTGDISVMMSDKTRERAFAAVTNVKGSEGVATGATIGGVLGAIVAGLTATGTVVATGGAAAPLVAGPLAAVLAGIGSGAVAGGIIGGLVGLGIGDARAKEYEKGLREGGILIAVRPKSKEHANDVMAAMHPRVTTGEVEPNVDYAGESSRRVETERR